MKEMREILFQAKTIDTIDKNDVIEVIGNIYDNPELLEEVK